MIHVTDNYLPEKDFKKLQDYCYNNDFKIHDTGEKKFLVLPTPKEIVDKLKAPNTDISLSFIRKAHKDFDTELRIHADNFINDKKTVMAAVLYINKPEGVTENGTRFYEHKKHGHRLESDDTEIYNDLIRNHSEVKENWIAKDKVYSKPNRLLVYDAKMFHSKFPQVIEEGERIVLVTFYTKKTIINLKIKDHIIHSFIPIDKSII